MPLACGVIGEMGGFGELTTDEHNATPKGGTVNRVATIGISGEMEILMHFLQTIIHPLPAVQ